MREKRHDIALKGQKADPQDELTEAGMPEAEVQPGTQRQGLRTVFQDLRGEHVPTASSIASYSICLYLLLLYLL